MYSTFFKLLVFFFSFLLALILCLEINFALSFKGTARRETGGGRDGYSDGCAGAYTYDALRKEEYFSLVCVYAVIRKEDRVCLKLYTRVCGAYCWDGFCACKKQRATVKQLF